jgi:hypothetical protein
MYCHIPVGDLLRGDVEQRGAGLAAAHLCINEALPRVIISGQVVRGYIYSSQFGNLWENIPILLPIKLKKHKQCCRVIYI